MVRRAYADASVAFATLRLTAKVVEILNALSCVAYRETRPIFSPSVGLLGLPTRDPLLANQIPRFIEICEILWLQGDR
jgi:hypothetical protein